MKKISLLAMGLGTALYYQQKSAYQVPQGNQDLSGQFGVVTGASTGIGKAIALRLAKQGMTVFATVRKKEDGEALSELNDKIHPLIMDVTKAEHIESAVSEVKEHLSDNYLSLLVNNAGVAVPGPVEMLPIDDLRWQFDVNVFGLVDVIQGFLPLINSSKGHIVNISSVAGRSTQPFLGAYSASKHALEALSDALRRELLLSGRGIDVVVIQPGNVKTPIWDKAEAVDLAPYEGTAYESLSKKIKNMILSQRGSGAEPEDVAQTVLGILLRKKNNARYIVSKNWPKEVLIPRTVPARILDKLVKKVLS